jgi:hypothetical protein
MINNKIAGSTASLYGWGTTQFGGDLVSSCGYLYVIIYAKN